MQTNLLTTTAVVVAIAGVVGAGVGFEVRGMPRFNRLTGNPIAGSQGGGQGRNFRGGMASNGGAGFMGRGAVVGEVTALDDKSLTIKLPDGSSKIVLISDTTSYETTTKVDKSGLKTGLTVRVIGSPNSDGSITGADVMLNPSLPTQMPKPSSSK